MSLRDVTCYTGRMSGVCPICQKKAGPRQDNGAWPFCSGRCKSIDLSKWMGGEYRMATEERAMEGAPQDSTVTAGNRKDMPS
jgi:endogenous inhibitor of DNA gyrase (YacG/DUF329 family)